MRQHYRGTCNRDQAWCFHRQDRCTRGSFYSRGRPEFWRHRGFRCNSCLILLNFLLMFSNRIYNNFNCLLLNCQYLIDFQVL
ncbi:hypothetical protein EVA_15541 [gut metagenome]|uniref:Uncharacterized protein n=1 Tax=gut metagenome TaxID=749906 RepID=J9G3F3_9ZZZZ